MSTTPSTRSGSKPPRTYDEITAHTVPDPDSSFRPTHEEEREALSRVELPRDEVLGARVVAALREVSGAEHVSFDLEGDRVVLRGPVRDMAAWRRIEGAVRAAGIESIDNKMHVA